MPELIFHSSAGALTERKNRYFIPKT